MVLVVRSLNVCMRVLHTFQCSTEGACEFFGIPLQMKNLNSANTAAYKMTVANYASINSQLTSGLPRHFGGKYVAAHVGHKPNNLNNVPK